MESCSRLGQLCHREFVRQNKRAEQCCKNLKYEIWVPLLDDFYLSDAQFPQLILGSSFSYCEVSQKMKQFLFIPDFLKWLVMLSRQSCINPL